MIIFVVDLVCLVLLVLTTWFDELLSDDRYRSIRYKECTMTVTVYIWG